MGRWGGREELLALIRRLRAAMPDIALRTTVMVGFPGETEEDFQELLEFLAEARFDWLGCFPYYQEADTPAAEMPDQLDADVKQERLDAVMRQAAELSAQALQRYVGKELTLLAEGPAEDWEPGWYAGRSAYQAPEVDGLIYFTSEAPVEAGQLYQVQVTESDIYDLIGETSHESAQ